MRLADKLATFSLEVTRSDLEAFSRDLGPCKKATCQHIHI